MRFFIIFLIGFLASLGVFGFLLYLRSLKKRLKDMEEKVLALSENDKTMLTENQNLHQRLENIEEIIATGEYNLQERFKNLDK